MQKTLTYFTEAVKEIMNEAAENSSDFALESDNGDLDALIESLVAQSAEYVTLHADRLLFKGDELVDLTFQCNAAELKATTVNAISGTPRAAGDGTASIALNCWDTPSQVSRSINPLRLLFAEATKSDGTPLWSRPVTYFTYPDDPEYIRIRDKYVGASMDRPCVVYRDFVSDGHSYGVAEVWGIQSNTDKVHLRIAEKPEVKKVNEQDCISVDGNLMDAAMIHTAGLALLTLRDAHAKVLLDRADRKIHNLVFGYQQTANSD